MEQITRAQWLEGLLAPEQGGRLERLLSIMSCGTLQQIQWLHAASFAACDTITQAETLQQLLQQAQVESQFLIPPTPWQGAAVLHTNDGQTGLLVAMTYAAMEDFQQDALQQQLQWLQQMQQLNPFPVRLLLLAFCKVPDSQQAQPGMLETWQWEEVLETGVQMAIGQAATVQEVLTLPIVAYESWLQKESQRKSR